MNILVTGSTGFVGSAFLSQLRSKNIHDITIIIRKRREDINYDGIKVIVSEIHEGIDLSNALVDIDTVVHLAARAHILDEKVLSPLNTFREVNVFSTLNLAAQAASNGVKRFIFISSIGVNGNKTNRDSFTAIDKPSPKEPYAISKYEAEVGLHQISNETDMELVIIRPPLVYGANAPGNFGRLMQIVERGIPLPLGGVHNKRSFVALPNLVDLIINCVENPAAANQTLLVSDGEDLSTAELLTRMSKALGRRSRLFYVPQILLEFGLLVIGKQSIAHRLCGNLQIDMSKTVELLDWLPPVSLDEGLHEAAQAFSKSESNNIEKDFHDTSI